MNRLKKYNEGWKKPNSSEVDKSNIQELKDILVDLQDLGAYNVEIIPDKFLNETYDIAYNIPYDLTIARGITDDKIKSSKHNLKIFNDLMCESYILLERLMSMGYEVAYFSDRKNINMSGLSYLEITIHISGRSKS